MNKTLKLFDKFSKLYEQEEVDAEVDVQAAPEQVSAEAEIYLTKLAALAFSYSPSIEEENMINSLSNEFVQTDPKKVTDEIQNILQSSNKSFASELENL